MKIALLTTVILCILGFLCIGISWWLGRSYSGHAPIAVDPFWLAGGVVSILAALLLLIGIGIYAIYKAI